VTKKKHKTYEKNQKNTEKHGPSQRLTLEKNPCRTFIKLVIFPFTVAGINKDILRLIAT